jgi:hypothetical protein
MSMKNSSDAIGNRTRDLSACSAVPQTNVPPRAPFPRMEVLELAYYLPKGSAFFLGGRRGTHTPKHSVNLIGESRNFKMLEFPLNQLQTYYGYLSGLCPLTAFIFSDLNYKMVIFMSQTESTTKHIFIFKKKHCLKVFIFFVDVITKTSLLKIDFIISS